MRATTLVAGLISAGLLGFWTDSTSAASRTWVSGLGDDGNACSRTFPCKTFAGALLKTDPGGEIDALEPGGFGGPPITITTALTIDGGPGVASVLVAGANGITVAAGASDVVTLRNLSFNGTGSGIDGIKFSTGAALIVENCNVMGFTANGINFAPNSAAKLDVLNTMVTNNTSGGIRIDPQSGGSAKVSILRTAMNTNGGFGLRAEATAAGSGAISVSLMESQASNNTFTGINAISGPSAVFVILNRAAIVNNGANGIQANQAAGSTTSVLVGYSTIAGNNVAGNPVAGGTIASYGNNEIRGNTSSDGTFSAITPQ